MECLLAILRLAAEYLRYAARIQPGPRKASTSTLGSAHVRTYQAAVRLLKCPRFGNRCCGSARFWWQLPPCALVTLRHAVNAVQFVLLPGGLPS